MAFQFLRDKSQNLTLMLVGDIDLEVTPDIKAQLTSQLADAASLQIDCKNISYLDSSGVSILVIAMQSCKHKRIDLRIPAMSDEALRVLQLARLEKILPIEATTGPAQLVDIDVFSNVGTGDASIADNVETSAAASGDDDLIAALAGGDMADAEPAPADDDAMAQEPEGDMGDMDEVPEPAPEYDAEHEPEPAAKPPAPEAAAPQKPTPSGGGTFKPGTF